jgi:hypothetical protein
LSTSAWSCLIASRARADLWGTLSISTCISATNHGLPKFTVHPYVAYCRSNGAARCKRVSPEGHIWFQCGTGCAGVSALSCWVPWWSVQYFWCGFWLS